MSAYPNIDPTTGLKVLTKRSDQIKTFRIDCITPLHGRTLLQVNSVTSANQNVVQGSTNITIDFPSVDDRYVYFRGTGGTTGEHYQISAVVVDSQQDVFTVEGMLYVQN